MVDDHAVVAFGPGIGRVLDRTAPVADEVAGGVKLEDRRRRVAALTNARLTGSANRELRGRQTGRARPLRPARPRRRWSPASRKIRKMRKMRKGFAVRDPDMSRTARAISLAEDTSASPQGQPPARVTTASHCASVTSNGEYPEWSHAEHDEVAKYVDGLTAPQQAGLRTGSELTAALADPRWRAGETLARLLGGRYGVNGDPRRSLAIPGDQASRHTVSEVGCSLIRCRVDAMPSIPHPVRWQWGRQSGRDRGLPANPSATASSAALIAAYTAWATAHAGWPLTATAFGNQLRERGFAKFIQPDGRRAWRGVGVRGSAR
ncbi:MAG: hypothetical protein EBT09_04825 [Actinobacteria bacterium]|nr:hypothetical protein [Actinomycetota bacterium]